MIRKITAIVTAFLFVFAASALGDDAEKFMRGVKDRYGKFKDLKADFEQKTMVKTLGREQVKSGTVKFKQPDKMRWDYEKPQKEQLLTDGYSLWIYQPEAKVVYMSKLDAVYSAKVPMQIFSGKIDAKSQFEVSLEGTENGIAKLRLKPQKDSGYEFAVLHVKTDDYRIEAIEIHDLYGNVTRLFLTNQQSNSKLVDSLFIYSPIPGVRIEEAPLIE